MRRFASTLAGLGAAAVTAVSFAALTPAAAAAPSIHHRAMCSTHWGTNPKHRGSSATTVATRVQAVRAGKHGCFDRLVIDLSGGARPPFSVRYVRHIVAEGSGRVLRVRGHAKLSIVVRGPAGSHYRASAVNLVNVSGFTTFRQVRGAGSFERVTSLGLGVRAKLPFRVFELGSSRAGWRIVIDVAH
jgi:hypothetical protein